MRTAMILAAGKGERLRPLTNDCPKPMVEVKGFPLMQRHVVKLAEAGFHRIVINHAWHGDKIENYFGDGSSFGIEILYSPEYMALETGGGICRALPMLGSEPFFVINGDIYCDMDFHNIPKLKPHHVAHLFLVKNPEHHPEGDFSLDNDCIMDKNGPTFTFSGMGVYHPKMFKDAPSGAFPLPQIWRSWIKKQQISGEVISHYWSDIGTVKRFESLRVYLEDD